VNRQYHNDLPALMWEAGYGRMETLRLLLDKGADPQLRDNRGKTALQMASEEGHEDAAKLLQERAAAADRSRRQDQ